nr:MAG TPA: hypothetical protein [Caudoviricetes sp.]
MCSSPSYCFSENEVLCHLVRLILPLNGFLV